MPLLGVGVLPLICRPRNCASELSTEALESEPSLSLESFELKNLPAAFLRPWPNEPRRALGALDDVGGYEMAGAVSRFLSRGVFGSASSVCVLRSNISETGRSTEEALLSIILFSLASRSRSNRTPPIKAGLLGTVSTTTSGSEVSVEALCGCWLELLLSKLFRNCCTVSTGSVMARGFMLSLSRAGGGPLVKRLR